jgi:xanthine dehydrogenase accessory factor
MNKEIRAIISAYDQAEKRGIMAALATVVKVDGSSYRRAGARMLITEDGSLTGAISGGCLEGDALRKARLVMTRQKAMLVVYDTTDEDDAKLGVGLGCNGIIHILIEPIMAGHPLNPVALLRKFISKRQRGVLITLFNMEKRHDEQVGTCMLIGENETLGTVPDQRIADEVAIDADTVMRQGNRDRKYYYDQDGLTCFIEYLEPPVSLIVIGAGNDARPVADMAGLLGWQVTIADGRANYVTHERFPDVSRRIIARPEELLQQVIPDDRTIFMLMTHNFNYDKAILADLLHLPVPFIGVLGPRKRLARMLNEIYDSTTDVTIPDNVFGPAGLDVGSENAEEIALSIVAQMQAVLKGRNAQPLKDQQFVHVHEQFVRTLEGAVKA